MEFWGVEVKSGKPLKVTPELGKVIHISQAALGEVKEKGSGLIPLRVNIDDQKHVLGSLSTETIPQVSFDLVFEKEFELSHGWKNGSVYFCGYSTEVPLEDDSEFGDEDDEDEEEEDFEIVPTVVAENGKKEETKAPANKGKAGKTKVAIQEPKKVDSDESSDDDDSDEDMLGSDDEDDSEDEKTPTPKKPVSAKKRANDSATKTPVSSKKAKTETPQKTDGKKTHVATPHPAKKGDKSSAAKAAQSPKSDSKVVCKSCSKTFNSEKGLDSHSKAKHP